ncbi:MAG TPA: GFA family protein [Rhizomicrobium sp.]|jgi:hypothetical protein|nr:GFA family protein [Rhizomicrobium sp.]
MATKIYRASCHCGAVAIDAALDLAEGTARCNCSICRKSRWWGISAKPDAIKGITGEAATAAYSFGTGSVQMHFCKTCGLRVYGKGHVEQIGGDFVAINVACLDGVSDEELAAIPIHYSNGRDNDWMHAPSVTGYL